MTGVRYDWEGRLKDVEDVKDNFERIKEYTEFAKKIIECLPTTNDVRKHIIELVKKAEVKYVGHNTISETVDVGGWIVTKNFVGDSDITDEYVKINDLYPVVALYPDKVFSVIIKASNLIEIIDFAEKVKQFIENHCPFNVRNTYYKRALLYYIGLLTVKGMAWMELEDMRRSVVGSLAKLSKSSSYFSKEEIVTSPTSVYFEDKTVIRGDSNVARLYEEITSAGKCLLSNTVFNGNGYTIRALYKYKDKYYIIEHSVFDNLQGYTAERYDVAEVSEAEVKEKGIIKMYEEALELYIKHFGKL